MRVLILGGTRFIGRRIAADLVARGDDVTVVHRGQTEPDQPDGCTHLHADRAEFGQVAEQVRALRPDAVIDTLAMSKADADAVLPHLPEVPLVLLSSVDVYRAYELLLADQGGEPVPITEDSPVRQGRYPLREILPGRGETYDKLDVEPGYLARGGTVLRLAMIYGEHDGQRREEFILRRVRAGRRRIPIGPGTFLGSRCYVGDVASAALAALDHPAQAADQIFNVCDPATDTVRDHAHRILAAADYDAELVTAPDEPAARGHGRDQEHRPAPANRQPQGDHPTRLAPHRPRRNHPHLGSLAPRQPPVGPERGLLPRRPSPGRRSLLAFTGLSAR